MSTAAALVAGLISGTLGALGLGGGSVLILWLTLFADLPQLQAQGINLVFFLPCACVAIILHHKKKLIDWRLWLYAAPPGLLGALLGTQLAAHMDAELLRRGFALLLLAFGLREFFHRPTADAES